MNEKEILILVLSNGDQLLTEVIEANGAYVCGDVLQILTRNDEQSGQVSMGLVPYLPYSDSTAGLAIPTNMAAVAFPGTELRNHYAERFGKIITPPAQKIILG